MLPLNLDKHSILRKERNISHIAQSPAFSAVKLLGKVGIQKTINLMGPKGIFWSLYKRFQQEYKEAKDIWEIIKKKILPK